MRIPQGFDITQECDGGFKAWLLVPNVNHLGHPTGGDHYRPLIHRNAASHTAALRCIRQYRREGWCEEPDLRGA